MNNDKKLLRDSGNKHKNRNNFTALRTSLTVSEDTKQKLPLQTTVAKMFLKTSYLRLNFSRQYHTAGPPSSTDGQLSNWMEGFKKTSLIFIKTAGDMPESQYI